MSVLVGCLKSKGFFFSLQRFKVGIWVGSSSPLWPKQPLWPGGLLCNVFVVEKQICSEALMCPCHKQTEILDLKQYQYPSEGAYQKYLNDTMEFWEPFIGLRRAAVTFDMNHYGCYFLWCRFDHVEVGRIECHVLFTEAMLWATLSKQNVKPLGWRPRRTDPVPRVRTGGDYSLLGRQSNLPKKFTEPYLGSSLKLNTFPSISVLPEVRTVPPR